MNRIPQDKKDRSIKKILDAAQEAFAEVGFAGARVDEIARRAGVNKAMIYYRIGDKATLYSEVLHRLFSHVAEKLAQNLAKVQTPEEKIKAYIRTFSRMIDDQPHLPSIMMREMASGGQYLPDIVVTDLSRIMGMLMGILDEGVRQGIFIDAKPSIVHLMVIGPIIMRKRMEFIVSRRREHNRVLRKLDKGEPVDIGQETERYILKALKRDVSLRNRDNPS
ncbi:MAG: TetR/AcrR family transcriptional regulator [Deltaproteobacteria bacterium]|nr:TetR/AcrR family transcriptional regulator [Deltaproteobacteria bacterium]